MLEALTNQPIAFWVSIVALIVSFISFLSNHRNAKSLAKIRTLEKRTLLLYEIISIKAKLFSVQELITTIESENKSIRENKSLMENQLGQKILFQIDDLDNVITTIKQKFGETSNELDEFQKECEAFNEKSDIAEIEKLFPDVRGMLTKTEKLLEILNGINEEALEIKNLLKPK
jgi:peptidoglycan hydrolase CwlO-like protein